MWIFQTLLLNTQFTDLTFLLSLNNKAVFIIGQVRFSRFLSNSGSFFVRRLEKSCSRIRKSVLRMGFAENDKLFLTGAVFLKDKFPCIENDPLHKFAANSTCVDLN